MILISGKKNKIFFKTKPTGSSYTVTDWEI